MALKYFIWSLKANIQPLAYRHLITLPKPVATKEILGPWFETHPCHMRSIVHADM